jgi:hypothetical protein
VKNFCFLLLAVLFISCKNKKEIPFTGFEPFEHSSKIQFDTIRLNPVYLYRKKYDQQLPDYYAWDVFRLNEEYDILHFCSSGTALDFGDARDSISINGRTLSLSSFFNGDGYEFRILQILKFKFEQENYFLLIGTDILENGNRLFDNTIFLIQESITSSTVLCPPLNLRGNNTHSFLPYYINDFNQDKRLDFLHLDLNDTIALYSVVNDRFVRQNEFIKLYRRNEDKGILYIDKANSNWPYPFFKSDSLHPYIEDAVNHYQERDFENRYYRNY